MHRHDIRTSGWAYDPLGLDPSNPIMCGVHFTKATMLMR